MLETIKYIKALFQVLALISGGLATLFLLGVFISGRSLEGMGLFILFVVALAFSGATALIALSAHFRLRHYETGGTGVKTSILSISAFVIACILALLAFLLLFS